MASILSRPQCVNNIIAWCHCYTTDGIGFQPICGCSSSIESVSKEKILCAACTRIYASGITYESCISFQCRKSLWNQFRIQCQNIPFFFYFHHQCFRNIASGPGTNVSGFTIGSGLGHETMVCAVCVFIFLSIWISYFFVFDTWIENGETWWLLCGYWEPSVPLLLTGNN